MASIDTIADRSTGSTVAGKAYFETSTNKFIVYNGSSWVEIDSDGTGAFFSNQYSVSLDGTNDYIQTSSSFASMFQSNFSISCWAKLNNTTDGLLKFLIGLNVSGTSRYQLYNSGSTLYSFLESGNVNGDTLSSASSGVTLTDWFHVCVTYEQSGTNLIQKMYMNGSLADSGTTASIDLANFDATPALLIGARLTNGQYALNGLIDELSFFDSVLSASVISSSLIDTSGSNPVPADISSLNPIHWWRMGDGDSGSGTTITDQGVDSNGNPSGNDGTLMNGANIYSGTLDPNPDGAGPDFSSSVPS